jgi:GAF domain-containing protein
VVHEEPFVLVVTITGFVPVAVRAEPTTMQAAVEQASEVVALARTAVGTVPAALHDDAPFVDRRRERISPLGEDSTVQVVVDEHEGVPRCTVPIVSRSFQVLSVVDAYSRDNWLSGT